MFSCEFSLINLLTLVPSLVKENIVIQSTGEDGVRAWLQEDKQKSQFLFLEPPLCSFVLVAESHAFHCWHLIMKIKIERGYWVPTAIADCHSFSNGQSNYSLSFAKAEDWESEREWKQKVPPIKQPEYPTWISDRAIWRRMIPPFSVERSSNGAYRGNDEGGLRVRRGWTELCTMVWEESSFVHAGTSIKIESGFQSIGRATFSTIAPDPTLRSRETSRHVFHG